MVECCCDNYTDDPKDTTLIDEIAITLPTDTKFLKNKSAMEKYLDLVPIAFGGDFLGSEGEEFRTLWMLQAIM